MCDDSGLDAGPDDFYEPSSKEIIDKVLGDYQSIIDGYKYAHRNLAAEHHPSVDRLRDAEDALFISAEKAFIPLVEALIASGKGLANAAGWSTAHDPDTCGDDDFDHTPCAGCFAKIAQDEVAKVLMPLLTG